MKTKVIITEIEREDLVYLFSTALYGSYWLSCNYSIDNNDKEVLSEEGACYEERIADCLLAGKAVELCDRYAEDEDEFFDSKLPHRWDKDDECMCYRVTLADIENALSCMLENKNYASQYVLNFINDEPSFDLIQGESIMQHILWGEDIYG